MSFEAVKQALRDGTLSYQEINQKLRRIINTKLQFHLFENELSSLAQAKLALKDPNLKKAFSDVTEQNLKTSMARSPTPVPKSPNKVVVLSRSKSFMTSFTEKLAPKCCTTLSLLEIEDINRTLTDQRDSIAIIHVSGKSTAQIVNKIAASIRKRVIIVNTNSPSLVLAPETYAKTINLFTYHPELGGLIAEKVFSPFSTTKAPQLE